MVIVVDCTILLTFYYEIIIIHDSYYTSSCATTILDKINDNAGNTENKQEFFIGYVKSVIAGICNF